MTRRRLVRLIPSVALVLLILVPSSGPRLRSPAAHPRPSLPSSSPRGPPSNQPNGLQAQEIARDTVVGPAGSEPDTAVEPYVAFGPDGSAYASSIVIRGPDREEGIAVNRSDDGGRSWNSPVLLEQVPARSGDDFPRIVVDTGASTSHLGRVYVTYIQRNRVVVRWSDERAIT